MASRLKQGILVKDTNLQQQKDAMGSRLPYRQLQENDIHQEEHHFQVASTNKYQKLVIKSHVRVGRLGARRCLSAFLVLFTFPLKKR